MWYTPVVMKNITNKTKKILIRRSPTKGSSSSHTRVRIFLFKGGGMKVEHEAGQIIFEMGIGSTVRIDDVPPCRVAVARYIKKVRKFLRGKNVK